ncbi:MAG: hypothetical protein RMK94_09950 [Armatimonadota bacterium]|nr:hypothetical protein [Armatimonadota bacterium]
MLENCKTCIVGYFRQNVFWTPRAEEFVFSYGQINDETKFGGSEEPPFSEDCLAKRWLSQNAVIEFFVVLSAERRLRFAERKGRCCRLQGAKYVAQYDSCKV